MQNKIPKSIYEYLCVFIVPEIPKKEKEEERRSATKFVWNGQVKVKKFSVDLYVFMLLIIWTSSVKVSIYARHKLAVKISQITYLPRVQL